MTTYTVYYKEKGSIQTKTMDVKAQSSEQAKQIVEGRGKEVITTKIIYK